MTLVWRACSMAAALGRSVTTAAYRRRSLAPAGTGAWLARCMRGAWRRRRVAIGTAWTVCLIGWTGVLLLPDHDPSMVAVAAHDDIRGPAIASSAGRTSNVSMPKPGTVGGQDIAFRSIGPPTRQPAPGGVARPLRFLLVLLAGLGSGGVAAAWLAGCDGIIDGIDQLQRRFPVPVLGSIAIPMTRHALASVSGEPRLRHGLPRAPRSVRGPDHARRARRPGNAERLAAPRPADWLRV
jgi:hypothetical protein